MEVIAIREGCYSELKINFEIANFVFLTTLILIFFYFLLIKIDKIKMINSEYNLIKQNLSINSPHFRNIQKLP